MRKNQPGGSSEFSDPTLPETYVDIDGEKFRLCFDFAALAQAKRKLQEQGVEINILHSLNFYTLDVDTLAAIFYAAAHRFHPKMEWSKAQKLTNLRTGAAIIEGLAAAYAAAMTDPKRNPREGTTQKA
jgi:hypothetical protein